MTSDNKTVEDEVIESETSRKLREALDYLKPETRKVLWMLYFEDKSINEIAKELGVSRQTISGRISSARKQLAKSLDYLRK